MPARHIAPVVESGDERGVPVHRRVLPEQDRLPGNGDRGISGHAPLSPDAPPRPSRWCARARSLDVKAAISDSSPANAYRASRSGSKEKSGGSNGTKIGTEPEMLQPGP